MGLTTWKKAPDGRVQKSDTIVAKNYLSDEELSQLNVITTSFLDLAESRARRHIITTMEDWKNRLKLSMRNIRLFKTVPISRISTDSIVEMMMILHCFHLTLIQKNRG